MCVDVVGFDGFVQFTSHHVQVAEGTEVVVGLAHADLGCGVICGHEGGVIGERALLIVDDGGSGVGVQHVLGIEHLQTAYDAANRRIVFYVDGEVIGHRGQLHGKLAGGGVGMDGDALHVDVGILS